MGVLRAAGGGRYINLRGGGSHHTIYHYRRRSHNRMQDSALAMASGHSLLASATLLPAALALRHIIVLYASACLLHRGLQFSEPP